MKKLSLSKLTSVLRRKSRHPHDTTFEHTVAFNELNGEEGAGDTGQDMPHDHTDGEMSGEPSSQSKSPIIRLVKKVTTKSKSDKKKRSASKSGSSSEKASSSNKRDRNANDAENREIPLLSGTAAFITLDNEPVEGMEKIAERKAFSPLNKGFYARDAQTLSVYVYTETKQRYSKVKLAIDGYMRAGMMQSLRYREGPIILLGGDEDNESVNMEVLVFYRGELKEAVERTLPPRNQLDFEDMLNAIIDNLKSHYSEARIVQAAPLGRFHHKDIKDYLDEDLFKHTRTIDLQPSDSAVKLYGPPLLLAGAAAGYYAFSVLSGFNQHAALTDEVQDLQRNLRQLTQNEVSIDVLEAREQFKISNDAEEEDQTLAYHLQSLAHAVGAVEGAEIRRLKTPGEVGAIADLSLAVPVGDYPSPLIQGRHLLDELVHHSEGYSMRLSQTRPSQAQNDAIIFHIEVIDGQ